MPWFLSAVPSSTGTNLRSIVARRIAALAHSQPSVLQPLRSAQHQEHRQMDEQGCTLRIYGRHADSAHLMSSTEGSSSIKYISPISSSTSASASISTARASATLSCTNSSSRAALLELLCTHAVLHVNCCVQNGQKGSRHRLWHSTATAQQFTSNSAGTADLSTTSPLGPTKLTNWFSMMSITPSKSPSSAAATRAQTVCRAADGMDGPLTRGQVDRHGVQT